MTAPTDRTTMIITVSRTTNRATSFGKTAKCIRPRARPPVTTANRLTSPEAGRRRDMGWRGTGLRHSLGDAGENRWGRRLSTAKANSSVKRGQIGRPGDGVDPSGGGQPVRSGGPAATDPRLGRTLPPDLSPLTEMHPRVK